MMLRGFPDSSVGKESACNAGDPGSIPGLWRSAGEEIGYPFQYSSASLVSQLLKNLPAMWENWLSTCTSPDGQYQNRIIFFVAKDGEVLYT